MMTTGMRIAVAIVRAWTRLYTWRLESSVRDARRAEIESDLWEHVHEPERAARSLDVCTRLVLGMFDDVRWSIGQRSPRFSRRAIVVAAASLTVFSIWWTRTTASRVEAPPAPDVPVVHWINREPIPPPPPPPPPLCNPPGLPVISPCTQWPRR
jgi:hypothetical protein